MGLPEWVLDELEGRAIDIGSPLGKIDYHHAILSKYDVMGLPEFERVKINDPRNILLVNHEAHLDKPIPTREEAAKLLYKIYGREAVKMWFDSIQWVDGPPFLLPEE